MATTDTFYRARYAVARQLVYYREPFAEAHVWQQRGDAFLAESDAYDDLIDRVPSERLHAWLHDRRVSLIVVPSDPYRRFDPAPMVDFVRGLSDGLAQPVAEVGPQVFRIAPPSRSEQGTCRR